jgi:hypothetical protein
MSVPVITRSDNHKTAAALQRIHFRNGGREAHQIVELARRYTQAAIRKMAQLMEGKAGTIKTLDKEGNVVEIDVEVPAAVQLKAAETLIERGYGKSPQAILLKGDGILPVDSKTMSVAEKIVALSQAQLESGETRDLEASEITELTVVEETKEEQREPVLSAADMI